MRMGLLIRDGFDLQLRFLATGYDMCHGARRDHDVAGNYSWYAKIPSKSPPMAGNSSAVISVACHPGVYEEKTAFMGLKRACISSWPDGIGHCSFAVNVDEDGMGVPMEEVHEDIRWK